MNYRLIISLAALVAVSGCATTRPADSAWEAPSTQSVLATAMPDADAADSAELVGDDAPADDDSAPVDTLKPGTGAFINKTAAAEAPPPPGAGGEVTFNFEGESLHSVVKTILGEILQQNYVIAPGVTGTVTFATAKPLRSDQALSILEMLLRWNNATLVWQDGRYTILPIAQALPGNLSPRTGPVKNARGYEVRAVPLQFISALEMEKVLKPYAKPEALINVDPARNMIVLAGTRAELENYLQTVEVFDVDWLAGMSVGIFTLQQAEAAKVVTELEKIFGEGSNTPLAGMFRFLPMEGVNGVMVITQQKKYLATIQEWLERFDLGSGEAGTRLYVYDVKNVKAADLADTLSNVFGTGGGSGGQRASGSVAPGLEPVRLNSFGGGGGAFGGGQNYGQNFGQKAAGNSDSAKLAGQTAMLVAGATDATITAAPAADAKLGNDAASGNTNASVSVGDSEDVRISSVEESNALIVRASAAQWESIRRVIERLDVVPLQVVIEAQIISVQLGDSLSHGVRWFFENAIAGANTGGTTPVTLFPDGTRGLASGRDFWGDIAGSINGGTTSWSVVGPNVAAVVTLLDSVTKLKVLSAPSLVVLNNQQATINSGSQVPVSSTSINLGTGGATTPINSTQYLQTGITLSVLPRVNPGGLVFLEIDQEDSTPGEPKRAGDNPPISQSSIQTKIAVQSGETVLLGGLIKQSDTSGTDGLPGLSRLPFIGGLFGSKVLSTKREELLVLITPRVISNADEARQITDDYKRQFRALTPMRPVQ